MKVSKTLRIIFIATILSLVLPACMPATPVPPTPTLQPLPVKLLILPFLGYAPFFIAQDEGYFTEQGLVVEFITLENSEDALPSLIQGKLDVSSGTLEVALMSAMAQGINLKIVADKGFADPKACTYNGWIARNQVLQSGELNNPETLKGKKFALELVSTNEYSLELLLKQNNLSLTDVEILDLPQPLRFESLGQGAADVVYSAEPWILREQDAGYGDVWKGDKDYLPNFQFSMIIFGPSILDKNPEAGKRFMVAYLKAVAKYNEGKTDRNIDIITKYTNLKPDELKRACWPSLKSDGSINSQSVLDFTQWAIGKNYLTQNVTTEQFWDSTFIDYANQTLKNAQP
jgi:NitT/TauT family transport system substrate-binding protein